MAIELLTPFTKVELEVEKKETNRKVAQAIKVTMLISIPSAVGLFILAKPVVMLLYPQRASVDMVASMIRAMSAGVGSFNPLTSSSPGHSLTP